MASRFKNLVIFIPIIMLVACGKVPETHYYTLELEQLADASAKIGELLHVQPFDATSVLKYDKLMYKTSRYEIKYDAYRRWAATPSTLLSEKAVEYFQDSQLFDQVVMDMPTLKDGYSLFGFVNHFEESLKDGKRIALVSISFDVYNLSDRKRELHKSIESTAPIDGETIESIMGAMSNATQSVFDQLANDMLTMNR